MELFISCVDVKNKKVIHPYIVTGTSDKKNESNGQLFKIQIRENQDVDLKIAIMAIVEKEHSEVLKLIHDSHIKNGIMQNDESFYIRDYPGKIKMSNLIFLEFNVGLILRCCRGVQVRQKCCTIAMLGETSKWTCHRTSLLKVYPKLAIENS